MEGRWSSVAAAEEDSDESRPLLKKGGSGITAATAAYGGAYNRRPHERKHERGGGSLPPPSQPITGLAGVASSRKGLHRILSIPGVVIGVAASEVELGVLDRYSGLVQLYGVLEMALSGFEIKEDQQGKRKLEDIY
ncbi:hypothetical protein Scep_004110 [Stephania cephalantha]|uniref:Uncharacterized protein n=1 Tax=Stephania cephalantha TaxID=152367 RepID=A0AAP0KRU2_9MAGN